METIRQHVANLLAAAEAAGDTASVELLRSALIHLGDAEAYLAAGRREMAGDELAMVQLTLEGLGHEVPPELAALIEEVVHD